jgi:hypothetical protein
MKRKLETIAYWFFSLPIIARMSANWWYFNKHVWPKHPWVRAWVLKKEMLELHWHSASVCNDPMNGCPGDFAEDYGRQMNRMEWELHGIEADVPTILLNFYDYLLSARNDELERSYYSTPWNDEGPCLEDLAFITTTDGPNSELFPY